MSVDQTYPAETPNQQLENAASPDLGHDAELFGDADRDDVNQHLQFAEQASEARGNFPEASQSEETLSHAADARDSSQQTAAHGTEQSAEPTFEQLQDPEHGTVEAGNKGQDPEQAPEPYQQLAQEPSGQVSQESTENSGEQLGQQTADQSTQDLPEQSEPVNQDTTEQLTQNLSEPSISQPTEQESSKPAEQIVQDPMEQDVQEPAQQTLSESPLQPTEQSTEQLPEQLSEQVSEQVSEPGSEQVPEEVPEQASEQASEQPPERSSEQISHLPNGDKPHSEASPQQSEKTSDFNSPALKQPPSVQQPIKQETNLNTPDQTSNPQLESLPQPKPIPPQSPSELQLAFPQSHEIIIPSYARWFHLKKIHSIEKQSLPEFFTNRVPSKTSQVYVKYRNFMVNSYRLNPNEYFTMTAARRNLCGDAGAILRIHKFLTKWGLINYQVDAKAKPKHVEPPYTGDYATKHDAPRGLFPFESYKPAIQLPDLSRLKKLMHQIDVPATPTSRAPTSSTSSPSSDKKRSFPDTDTSGNKAKIQRPNILEMVDKDWSKEDLEKLLEGLQKYQADWQRVAQHVGNKTPEQCILRFLQLPIEDAYLQSHSGNELGPLKYAPHLPFSKADNPVMSTIAFLTGLVDPNTVKQMTDRAINSAKQEQESSVPENNNYVKEGSEIALGALGYRSHVFATNEERQMHALAHEMTQTQTKKVNLKLKLASRNHGEILRDGEKGYSKAAGGRVHPPSMPS